MAGVSSGTAYFGTAKTMLDDLSKELAYMHAHSSFTAVQLVLGTDAFKAGGLPALGGLLSQL